MSSLLAARLPLAGVVLVSPTRRARVLWHHSVADATTLAEFDELGRAALIAGAQEIEANDGAVVGFTVRDHTDLSSAVVLAIRRDEQAWSSAERGTLRAAYGLVRDELLVLAHRPQPGRDSALYALDERIRTAVDKGEFALQYQPEVELRSGRILAVEALVRWNHPVLGRLEPDTFIPFAERSSLISTLGNWVIEHALAQLAAWNDDRLMLRVNVSPAQLSDGNVAERFAHALAEAGVTGSQVCVEFTETAATSDVTKLADAVRALRALGITTALDDLATGYSTLSRLRALPVDVIKIDRSLVVDIDRDARARALVRSLLQLGDELDLGVVAEGIENAREAATLVELGCRRGQGHYFARPQDASTIEQFLRTGKSLP